MFSSNSFLLFFYRIFLFFQNKRSNVFFFLVTSTTSFHSPNSLISYPPLFQASIPSVLVGTVLFNNFFCTQPFVFSYVLSANVQSMFNVLFHPNSYLTLSLTPRLYFFIFLRLFSQCSINVFNVQCSS